MNSEDSEEHIDFPSAFDYGEEQPNDYCADSSYWEGNNLYGSERSLREYSRT